MPRPYRAWSPAYMETLLWLDASDASTITENSGSVSQWDSKGSQTISLTQATSSLQPIYESSKKRVKFDGVDDQMTVASRFGLAADPDVLIVMVSQIYLYPNPNNTAQRFLEIGPGDGTVGVLSCGTVDSDIPDLIPPAWAWLHNNGNKRWGNYSEDIGNDMLLSFAREGGLPYGDGDFLWVDGTIPSFVASAQAPGDKDSTDNFILFNGTNNNAMPGYLYEMVISEDISTDNRQRIEGYLAWKWGLPSKLPVGHPYREDRPRI